MAAQVDDALHAGSSIGTTEDGTTKEPAGDDTDRMQIDEPEPAIASAPLESKVEIPDFAVPPSYSSPKVYTPRAVKMSMIERDPIPEDLAATRGADESYRPRDKPWVGDARNLAVFQPAYHPLLFPPAGTGTHFIHDPDLLADGSGTQEETSDLSPFGVPLSDAAPTIPTNEQTAELRRQSLRDLVPLESAYATSLHPLPAGLVNTLGKRGHRHHHHHRRDRRRSSAGEEAGGTTSTSSATQQKAKLASSVMIPGSGAFALPPAYAGRRRLGALSPDQVQAQNEELSQQRAEQRAERGELDLVELGVGFSVNPVATMVQRNNKCMLSRDWKTVWREIQFTRALERVDQLKDQGAWSFRQLKKSRGPPMSGKSHWDWLLDEMRWMQADFKEERRWKTVVAQEMALLVKHWWKASAEDRAKMMVGGRKWGYKWHQHHQDGETDAQALAAQEQHRATRTAADDADEAEAEAVLTSLQERDRDVELAEDHIATESNDMQVDASVQQPLRHKPTPEEEDAEGEEDGEGEADEDQVMDHATNDDEDAAGEDDDEMGQGLEIGNGDIEQAAAATASEGSVNAVMETEETTLDKASGRTSTHTDKRVLDSTHGTQHETLVGAASGDKPPALDGDRSEFIAAAPAIRKPILDSDAASVMVDIKSVLAPQAEAKHVHIPEDVGLADLFPDLSVYTAPAVKEDKVEKRVDESAGRLTHTTRLMDIRPVIVSAIKPSMTRRPDGKWEDLWQGFLHEPEDDLEEFKFDPSAYPAREFSWRHRVDTAI